MTFSVTICTDTWRTARATQCLKPWTSMTADLRTSSESKRSYWRWRHTSLRTDRRHRRCIDKPTTFTPDDSQMKTEANRSRAKHHNNYVMSAFSVLDKPSRRRMAALDDRASFDELIKFQPTPSFFMETSSLLFIFVVHAQACKMNFGFVVKWINSTPRYRSSSIRLQVGWTQASKAPRCSH